MTCSYILLKYSGLMLSYFLNIIVAISYNKGYIVNVTYNYTLLKYSSPVLFSTLEIY